MPRIRTIKPEFWSSPGVTEMNPWARLTFIAMWNWADDFGRGTYEPRELMGFVFPREDDMTVGEFRRHVGEIHRHVGVKFYTVSERHYFEISTWKRHQKTDPRLKQSKYPGPDEGTLIDPVSMQVINPNGEPHQRVDVLHPHVDVAHTHVGAGTGEQGNRGTGEGGGQGSSNQLGYPQPVDNEPHNDPPSSTTSDAPAHGATAPGGTPDQWSNPLDPRCYKHRNLPRDKVPACRDCAQAREWFKDKDQAAKNARRAAIDNCDLCDDNGLRTIHQDGRSLAIKCDHGHPHQPPF